MFKTSLVAITLLASLSLGSSAFAACNNAPDILRLQEIEHNSPAINRHAQAAYLDAITSINNGLGWGGWGGEYVNVDGCTDLEFETDELDTAISEIVPAGFIQTFPRPLP